MGLKARVGQWFGRREIDAAREGKRGEDMKAALAFLDGKKRYLMLVATIAQLWVLKAYGVDIGSYLGISYSLLKWDPADMLVSPELLSTTVFGVIAVVDGIRKDVAARKVKA